MSGLYWWVGLIVTSKSANVEETLGHPDAEMVADVPLCTFGVDVCGGLLVARTL